MKNGRWTNKNLPAWTKKALINIWQQLSEDHEARNDFMRPIMWTTAYFLRHVVGETKRKARSRPHMCASTARGSVSKISCGGSRPTAKEEQTQYEWLVVFCVWNARRMADAEWAVHSQDRRHDARSYRLPSRMQLQMESAMM